MHVSYNERISGKIKERYSTILYISCTTCSSNQGCTTFPFQWLAHSRKAKKVKHFLAFICSIIFSQNVI